MNKNSLPRRGILLANLGTPDSPEISDVRRYLKEFLMDPYVIDIPFLARWCLVNLLIAPFRAKSSSKAYQTIWRQEGSPLLYYSTKQKEELTKKRKEPLALGMNYGKPSIEFAVRQLLEQRVKEILFIPLYPHYALSSFKAIVQKFKKVLKAHKDIRFKVHPAFYKQKEYIRALSQVTQEGLPKEYDHVLFSYHGIPERHIFKADTNSHCKIDNECCNTPSVSHQTCYKAQVLETSRLVAQQLNMAKNKFSVSFQSRLGREPWLKPFTDEVLAWMPKKKIKKLVVLCPSFTSDCLETLEEIDIRGREIFLKNGGKEFTLIPCMNDSYIWIEALNKMIQHTFRDSISYKQMGAA